LIRLRHRIAMQRVVQMRGWFAALMLLSASPAMSERVDPNESAAIRGVETTQGRPANWFYAQHRKLDAAIATLAPQRPAVVDTYVVSVGFDSDAVFGREAAEAARVLSRRFGANGRTLTLAAGNGAGDDAVPSASPSALSVALGAVATAMDVREDVLILYITTHGAPKVGLAWKDGDTGFGMVAPQRLKEMLDGFGFRRRMLLISACFSGAFVPLLANDDTVVVTAASATTTSFGCAPSNDWTFFGDALINNALRGPAPFDASVYQAFNLISDWETRQNVQPSDPQYVSGARVAEWLAPLDAAAPVTPTPKTGRPSVGE